MAVRGDPAEQEILVEMQTPALRRMTTREECGGSKGQMSVAKSGKQWLVRREGARRATRAFDTAEEAEAFVRSCKERLTDADEQGHDPLPCDRK